MEKKARMPGMGPGALIRGSRGPCVLEVIGPSWTDKLVVTLP